MAATGRPLEDDELIEYILVGLNQDYDPIACAVIAHTDPVSMGELYSKLLTFETHRSLMGAHEGSASSANAVHRGRGRGGRGGFGRGGRRDSPRQQTSHLPSMQEERPHCKSVLASL
jgi:hypothetical protein